jgi:glutamate--cysteine ligase catalytic subunit
MANKVDELLAQHVAHLFIRDPLVLFKEKLEFIFNRNENKAEDNEVDNFENIQSMNWQSMRFKPPPLGSKIGWRVEFRPIELQFTEFENTAFCFFIIFLTRVMKTLGLNFLMPISKVDVNMQRAQLQNACLAQKFYFRQNIFEDDTETSSCKLVEMSLNEILNGCEKHDFKGIFPILNEHLNAISVKEEWSSAAKLKFQRYLDFLSKRANGELMTPASYMRKFVMSHPKYGHDSIVTEEINYDLLWHIYLMQSGKLKTNELIDF